ncbi:PucR family transcriptional regulator [Streptomyces tauricus]|uniref:PucR family transcriptional regulator n=1 Tax=Streptomyces tauricus TaxID=68274 RepID=UPI0034419D44
MLAVTTLVLRGYHHEAARLSAGERDARYGVYAALTAGEDPAGAAHRAGLSLAERYLVLSLHLSGPDVEGGPPLVAHHRRANTIQRVLAEHSDGDVLAVVGDPTATALLPVPAAVPSATDRALRGLLSLVDVLDVPVHVGAAVVAVADIPAAAQCAEVAEIAVAVRRPAGVYHLADVLVEYQLTRPGPAFQLLLERLAPLDDHQDWEETLRTYLRLGCDRRRTAAELHVHPNSVDYRLSRLASTCGFDATDPAQRAVAHAALCVRDVAAHRAARRTRAARASGS